MKILLTGANGFVGAYLKDYMTKQQLADVIPSPSLRHMTQEDIYRIVEESQADVIIHTAAISDIPTCAANPEASYEANVLLPLYLAQAAKERKLVCFSSDQVYSGLDLEGPYTEDVVKPGNLYAEHKLEMENRVLDLQPDAVMLRAEWMYDYKGTRANYILQMRRSMEAGQDVAFSSKQYRGITYLREVAESMAAVIKLPGGAYNYGSETKQSMFDVTREFLEYVGANIQVLEGAEKGNLWMDCSKARSGGVEFSDISVALKKCWDDFQAER